MILEIDMGNSRIKWRCRGESGSLAHGILTEGYQGLLAELAGRSLTNVWVASVLDEGHNQTFARWCQTHFHVTPEFAQTQVQCAGVTNSYAEPRLMGVDRWLAMLAAFNHAGGPCVVVQAGSAITADLLSPTGKHLGGYIGPGLTMMRRALEENTRRVRPQPSAWAHLSTDPGTDTDGAVKGALTAMALGLVARAQSELNLASGSEPALILTGGDGPALAECLEGARLVPELVLDGLAFACR
ncbi:type III pantothenate kinase [Marinimicrobium sp. ABcell2]|uniref:type III pantothenate kinase n=1 Tax=Marinimicrobium sp. ABcell2 TaxID=3069751 RepID=UPI0027B05978|nr:type III pantothenate kinase [Marinimicrobium sp. ABcell2]MDQ2078205.1 type III pantothenate kinase [Marinimicrobium sp. ABcell2]